MKSINQHPKCWFMEFFFCAKQSSAHGLTFGLMCLFITGFPFTQSVLSGKFTPPPVLPSSLPTLKAQSSQPSALGETTSPLSYHIGLSHCVIAAQRGGIQLSLKEEAVGGPLGSAPQRLIFSGPLYCAVNQKSTFQSYSRRGQLATQFIFPCGKVHRKSILVKCIVTRKTPRPPCCVR